MRFKRRPAGEATAASAERERDAANHEREAARRDEARRRDADDAAREEARRREGREEIERACAVAGFWFPSDVAIRPQARRGLAVRSLDYLRGGLE